MARTVKEIQTSIEAVLTTTMADAGVVIDTTTWSKVNVMRLCCYVFAACGWVLESIVELLQKDTWAYIATMKPGTPQWYASMALNYQHGFALLPETDKFDNAGRTDSEIAESKVVAYAACVEEPNQHGRIFLRVKVAGAGSDDLTPLPAPQLAGVAEYIKRVKYAGIPVSVESNVPDQLKMQWTVYYDPLILDGEGNRLDGTNDDAVRKTIKEYLTKLPFNGIYAIQRHEDYLQQLEGVVLCPVQMAQRKYGPYDWEFVNTMITPDAGYLRFADDEDLVIDYVIKGAF